MGFNPYTGEAHPCWHCTWYDGMAGQGTCAQCAKPRAARLCATPEYGCAFWERDPGSDDEPLSPQQMATAWRHLRWPEPVLRRAPAAVERRRTSTPAPVP